MFRKRMVLGYVVLLPFLLHFSIFVIYPFLRTVLYALTDFNLLTMQDNFVWLDNFRRLFADDLFFRALKNTAYYVLIDGTGVVVFGLLMALSLNLKRKGIGVFRTMYYLPVVVDWVIVSIVFMFIFEPTFGIANYVLRTLGLQPQQFLQSSTQALPLITISSIWKGVGYYAVFYLAALQDIPAMLMEAADIDGANALQKFVYITLPQLAPISLFVIIMASIGSLKGFDQFYIMTGGGPARSTTTIMLYFYEHAFGYTDIGYGASVAVVFTVFVLFFVLLQRLLLSRMSGSSGNH